MKMKATLKLLGSSVELQAEPLHTHALPIRAHMDTHTQGVCVPVLRARPAFPPLVLLVNIKSHPMNSYLLQEQTQILVTQTQLSVEGHTLLLNERLKPVSPG